MGRKPHPTHEKENKMTYDKSYDSLYEEAEFRKIAIDAVVKDIMVDTYNPKEYDIFMEAIREDSLYYNVDEEKFKAAIASGNFEAIGREIGRAVFNYCELKAINLASARFDDRDRTRDSGSNYLRANHDNF